MAKAVVAVMDAWEVKKNLRRVFRLVDSEIRIPSDQQIFSLRNKYSRVYQRYAKPTVTCHHWSENQTSHSWTTSTTTFQDPFLAQSTLLWRGTNVPLHLSTVDSNTPMFVKALIDLGATGMFIDIEFIRSKNIWTHQLPRAIPVYNVDGTPNEAGHITKSLTW